MVRFVYFAENFIEEKMTFADFICESVKFLVVLKRMQDSKTKLWKELSYHWLQGVNNVLIHLIIVMMFVGHVKHEENLH